MRFLFTVGSVALVLCAAPAMADVTAKSDAGFIVRISADVGTAPADSWKALVAPAGWWSGRHTFSGDAANLTLDPAPGGCFCERFPAGQGAPPGSRSTGGVQHMRVIYAEPGRVLRMAGALGPLQSEALTGTLTVTLKAVEGGTRIQWEYVVGGYMRYKPDEIAPAVDRMLAGQLAALAQKLGPIPPSGETPAPAPAAAPATPKPPSAPAPSPTSAKPVVTIPKPAPAKPASAQPAPVKPATAKPAPAASTTEEAAREAARAAFDKALGAKPAAPAP